MKWVLIIQYVSFWTSLEAYSDMFPDQGALGRQKQLTVK